MTARLVRTAFVGLLALPLLCSTGCTTAKVIATPITVVRDVVDIPFASIANLFEYWSSQIQPGPPSVGIGVGLGGVSPTVGFNLGYYVFKPLSWIFGGADYLVCRSLYPCWPAGISPWKRPADSIGSLYFPNTRYMWSDRHMHDAGDATDEPAASAR